MVTPTTKWIWINCAWQMMLSVLFLEDCYCLSWEQVCISQGSQKNWTSRLYTHIRTDLLYSMCVLSRSVMSNSSRPHVLQPARFLCPWGFSRQEYWSGLPFPSPGDYSAFTPVIIDADKLPDLQGELEIWRPRRVSSAVLFRRIKRLETQKGSILQFESKGRKKPLC